MKRTYYFCEANHSIYTEREKAKSDWPGFRFEKIGEYKSRREAEEAYMADKDFSYWVTDDART